MTMTIGIVVAAGENGAIGKDNDLPWHLPADLRHFKNLTKGHTVIAGRRCYESFPEKYRPLPDRHNIVLTRRRDYEAPGATVVHSLSAALDVASGHGNEVFIIGGGELYRETLEKDLVDIMHITRIHHTFDADTIFPEIDTRKWKLVSEKEHPQDENHAYSFTFRKYVRRGKI